VRTRKLARVADPLRYGPKLRAFVENPERFLAGKLGLMLHQLWKWSGRKRAGQENWAVSRR